MLRIFFNNRARRFRPTAKGGRIPLLSLRTFLRLALDPSKPAGDCTAPVHREVHARDKKYHGEWKTSSHTVWYPPTLEYPSGYGVIEQFQDMIVTPRPWYEGRVLHKDIQVRCRKCNECLAHRQRTWYARGFAEMGYAKRTWMLTLTMAYTARLHAQKSGDAPAWLRREVQLYLKRLRKEVPPLRFLCVIEEHKDGTPHAHLLIHDLKGIITKRAIQRHWHHGFTNCKLADNKSVSYVVKYVTKQIGARVRASVRYGQGSPVGIAKRSEGV